MAVAQLPILPAWVCLLRRCLGADGVVTFCKFRCEATLALQKPQGGVRLFLADKPRVRSSLRKAGAADCSALERVQLLLPASIKGRFKLGPSWVDEDGLRWAKFGAGDVVADVVTGAHGWACCVRPGCFFVQPFWFFTAPGEPLI
jgi:hypothetical protein